jgi:anaphase-promoting complex subunit 2
VYTIVENMAETSKNGGGSGNAQELLGDDEVEHRSGASVENQLRMEMTVYEVYEIKFFINFEL